MTLTGDRATSNARSGNGGRNSGGNWTRHDRNTWAGFCRYGNCDDIIDRAHMYASMFEQGEIKNPITSLQSWLNETYPETAAYLAYRARKKGGVK